MPARAPTAVPTQPSTEGFLPHHARQSRHARLEWPFDAGARPYAPSLSGRAILLAFDGSTEAAAAARMAGAMASQLHALVNVVSIVDTTPVPIPFPLDVAIAIGEESAGGQIHQAQERRVRDEISAVLSRPIDWPTSIELGHPADAIARHASRAKAALVVMGLRRHGHVDRLVHDETVLSVMRSAAGPVLSVVAGATGLPQRALVAMDFGRTSVHAAAAVAQLMAVGGLLTLAYVESTGHAPPGSSEGAIHALGLHSAFEHLERELASDVLRINHVVLHQLVARSPSEFLLEYADGSGIDLLAAGSARHGRLERALLGSVSAEIVRAGRYSTLIVPPDSE
jgi:nucleotide-binding universal stress UspA family protein